MVADYYCACTKKKCDGECRKLHLFRKRPYFKSLDWDEVCPAAYRKDRNGNQRTR
jgi:hypothetical protein